MTTSLEKSRAALKAYQNSKISFKCNVCGKTIRLTPTIPTRMAHKDCSGVFVEVSL